MLGTMRWRLAAALGLGLGLAHACADEGFTCDDDEQCTLAGEPGRCVEGGRCAYPNAECPSGLAYPQGAPGGLAGECVPSDAAASDTGGDTTATGEPSTTRSEGTTAGDTEAADGSSSGELLACEDLYEPNDDIGQPSSIPFGAAQGCNISWEGALGDSLDADWFALDTSDGACPPTSELTFVTDLPLQLCVVPRCGDVTQGQAELVSCDAELVPLGTVDACCGLEQVRVIVSCGDSPPSIRLGVAASADSPMCMPYQAGAFL